MSRRRPFAALAVAETFSIAGTRLSTIAIPWLVLTTTGSASLTGLVAFAEMLPYVLSKALGGPLIDRVGARRVAVSCDAVSVLVVGLVPLLHLLGALTFPLLLPIVFAMGALRGPSDSAKYSMVPDVAEQADMPLERVTGVAGVIERLGTTVGAGLAGGLVALVGPSQALAVNAATFALAALLVRWGIPATPRPAEPVATGASITTYRDELEDGWDFLRKDAVLVGIVTMLALTNLLDQAWSSVVLPVWIKDAGHGAGLLGLMFAVFSACSVGGAALAAALGERLPRLPVYAVAFLVTGLPRFLVYALDSPVAVVMVTLAVAGFASGFLNPILGAVIFERIPKPLMGRVSSLSTALCWVGIPFGGLVGGALVTLAGVRWAMLGLGLAYFVVTLLPLARRSFREFGSAPRRATADETAAEVRGDQPVVPAP
ncbi:MFS transporter [Luteipulveratus sp. YIM 133132]|uniref:MFS transporter n=1 Tax=Luteipulveratus flavus TaxID=3031728 RepID=A0ABT6C804_9MICO|nr:MULTISPECIES: MFS transporter [unclassified Luteipulveratus]MDE9365872.1 MFS transporter [Luteipulveratus sp. YIM 133132]MDF8265064.1 MFS transporter [Luteipulveratus sp. YIM 133296]